ncbi:MAG: RlmE family RNA methyltransferase [Pseudomonadota bacterium]|nr:RlmE family RNA methyltransferase [Pseudomonadota bacterium]
MSKKIKSWYSSHSQDTYVKKAQKENYRSRACYKLEEIDKKYKLIKPNLNILDLGSSPGSWCQYMMRKGNNVNIIAIDLIDMLPIRGVKFINMDIYSVREYMQNQEYSSNFNLVTSDIAPNITGMKTIDTPAMINIAEEVREIALSLLCESGNLLVKLFNSRDSEDFISDTKRFFRDVVTLKPKASRSKSSEIYMLALEYKTIKV